MKYLRDFLKGFGMVLDLSGAYDYEKIVLPPKGSIETDWKKIGSDFKKIISYPQNEKRKY